MHFDQKYIIPILSYPILSGLVALVSVYTVPVYFCCDTCAEKSTLSVKEGADVLLRMRSKFHLLPILDEKEWEAELDAL